jgi:hypothetical protein
LGVTELDVGVLVEEGPDKKTQPYTSKGKVVKSDHFKVDGKNTTKGTLFYEAEFYPCAHIRVDFAPVESALEMIKEGSGASSTLNMADEPHGSVSAVDPATTNKASEDDTVQLSREEIIKARRFFAFLCRQ